MNYSLSRHIAQDTAQAIAQACLQVAQQATQQATQQVNMPEKILWFCKIPREKEIVKHFY